MTLIRMIGIGLFLFTVLSCGALEEAKKKEAEKAHAEQLQSEQQAACNGEGKFYDNVLRSGQCSEDFALAKWACNRAGIGQRIEVTKAARFDNPLESIDLAIQDGYRIHQCGDSQNEMIVILVKQSVIDDKAETAMRRVSIRYPSLTLNFGAGSSSVDLTIKPQECVAIRLDLTDTVTGEQVPTRFDLVAKLGGKSEFGNVDFGFFSDDKCLSAISEITIKSEASEQPLFLKAKSAGGFYIEASTSSTFLGRPAKKYVSARD